MKMQPHAVLMAAVHLLTKNECTSSGSEIFDKRGNYPEARCKEVARLAWKLAEAVEATEPTTTTEAANA